MTSCEPSPAVQASCSGGRAGHRAYERGDIPAAVSLLARATDLLPPGDRLGLECSIALGYALHDAGELERANEIFSRCVEEAERAGENALAARGRVGRVSVAVITGAAFASPLEATRLEIAKLDELDDEPRIAEAWYLVGNLEGWLGRSELSVRSHGTAMEHARRAGNRRLIGLSVGLPVIMEAWGFGAAPDGLRVCDELLTKYQGTSIEPSLRIARSLYLSFLGEAEAAQGEHTAGVELYRQFGNELFGAATGMSLADLRMRAGRLEEAEAAAREGADRLERLGEQGFRSTVAGFLAEALCRQGRYEEADEWARTTADLAMEGDFDPEFRWRAVRARVLAHRGEFEEAEKLAREGVEIVEQTDWWLHRGQAQSALGEVLELAGRVDQARASYEQAVDAFERKGVLPDAEAARQRLEQLA
ncbi:MAG: tetratricopeptide repeat protein [Actinobacteria bacterium]|nr:MAG: tetratricopeptide repeat protein [Actinomycetota bacterium]